MTLFHFLPVVIISVLYLIFFYIGKPITSSASDWFSKSRFDNTWWMLCSLIATSLTVSGGIIASISGSQFYGPWFLLAPLSAAIGLIVFAFLHKSIARRLSIDHCFLTDLRKGVASPLLMSFAAASLIIGAFIAGWEIHIASQAIASFYRDIPFISSNVFLISLGMAILAGLYISKGGWDRSVFTDIIQAFAIFLFLIILAYKLISPSNTPFEPLVGAPIGTLSLWLFGLALFINNIGYSLVSPNNWQIAQSAGNISVRIFALGALLLFIFSACIYLLSAYIPTDNPFGIFASQDILTAFLVPVLPLFVWSTIDTSSVALSHLAEGLMSSMLNTEAQNNAEAINNLRKQFPLIFLIAAVLVSHLLNTLKPNIFQSLLAATTSLIVFVPALFMGLLADRSDYQSSRRCALILFCLFATVLFTSVGMMLSGAGEYIFLLSIGGFIISGFIVWFYGKGVNANHRSI